MACLLLLTMGSVVLTVFKQKSTVSKIVEVNLGIGLLRLSAIMAVTHSTSSSNAIKLTLPTSGPSKSSWLSTGPVILPVSSATTLQWRNAISAILGSFWVAQPATRRVWRDTVCQHQGIYVFYVTITARSAIHWVLTVLPALHLALILLICLHLTLPVWLLVHRAILLIKLTKLAIFVMSIARVVSTMLITAQPASPTSTTISTSAIALAQQAPTLIQMTPIAPLVTFFALSVSVILSALSAKPLLLIYLICIILLI